MRQLLGTPDFRLAGRLFGNIGPEMESCKHQFGLKRRCSVDTLANFLSEYSHEESGEDEQFGEIKVRS